MKFYEILRDPKGPEILWLRSILYAAGGSVCEPRTLGVSMRGMGIGTRTHTHTHTPIPKIAVARAYSIQDDVVLQDV